MTEIVSMNQADENQHRRQNYTESLLEVIGLHVATELPEPRLLYY